MKTVTVSASSNYSVIIDKNLLGQVGQYLTQISKPCTVAVITDSNVAPLYYESVEQSLLLAGFNPIQFVFPAGEESKNAETYLQILNFLAGNQLTRSDMILALGGGVVGDIAGFAAATYLRGISYIQIPTTLLAMVDSSVGGKTAIDLSIGKNLVGAFHQPKLVLCDTNTLDTLTAHTFLDGCAEVIKYGILYDPQLFEHLAKEKLNFLREYVISRCVALKRDVVAQDEFDTGARQMLNLGHTFGHSIEANSQFAITHGHAVSIGINMAAKASFSLQLCNEKTWRDIENILLAFNLPVSTSFSAEELSSTALADKKRTGSTINLVLPCAIGSCILHNVPVKQLKNIFQTGL